MTLATCTYALKADPDDVRTTIRSSVEKSLQQAQDSGQSQILTFCYPLDDLDALAWLEQVEPTQEAAFYWEYPLEDLQIAAHTSIVDLKSRGTGRFDDVEKELEKWKRRSTSIDLEGQESASLLHAFGAFSFFDEVYSSEWSGFGPAYWFIPRYLVKRQNGSTYLILSERIDPNDTIDELLDFFDRVNPENVYHDDLKGNIQTDGSLSGSTHTNGKSSPSTSASDYNRWLQNLEQAKDSILSGEFEKIVLSRSSRFRFNQKIDPFSAIARLRDAYPNCYTFLLKNEANQHFIGSTPELLATFDGNQLYTESLAGSTRRGDTDEEEKQLETYLQTSSKEQAEHHYVVDAVTSAIRPHTVEIEQPHTPIIRKLSNVQHLLTPINATLKQGTSPLTIVRDLHPTPAVGGTPTRGVRQFIKKLEKEDRGLYAGPIGWLNAQNKGTFAVAIRSGLIHNNRAHLYAGCGIVEDSTADREWDEAELKFKPMKYAIHAT